MKISQLNALALALLACVSLAACSPAKQEKTETPAPAAQEQTQQDQQPKSDELFGEDKQEADQAQPATAEPDESNQEAPAQEGEAPVDGNTPTQEPTATPADGEQEAQADQAQTVPADQAESAATQEASEPAPTPVEAGPAIPAQGENVAPTDSNPAAQPAVMETPAYPVVAVDYRIIQQSIQCKETDRNVCQREEIIAAVTNIPAINEYFEKWFPESSKRSVSNEVKLVADVQPSDSLTRVFFVGQNQNLATFVVKKFVNPSLTEDYVVFDLKTNKPLEIASVVGSDAEFNYLGLNTDITLSVNGKRVLPEYLASASDAGKNSISIQNHATDLLYNILEAKYRDYLVETYGNKYNVADLDQLIELRSQEGFTLYFSDNFNFTADGVKFFYNNGVLDTDPNTNVPMNVELLVPYYELKGIFKPQYLLGYNLDRESLFNF